MADLHFVENCEALDELAGDFSGIAGGAGAGCFEILTEVAVLDIFHCDADALGVLVPAHK